ncbi:ribosome biogenesis GTPase [Propionivibrio dicarboxylicus]|uniref:Small ribosomal subunit biogenesis GTPase RsgA n=1 Tax=Propionivibrio dicarboxylicus TaxID=83767 RepID=A0A1G7ZKR2_9RHOO|nr:ribosome small subunit-dependent GTPase A [Propionivibrio dicarboxylicus]SDH09332.1 ribosome biogenesis GTPase [Propionivibrio dicarboxylicus]
MHGERRVKESGTIVAAHGRQYRVELASGELLNCFTRGKKSDVACGDRVEIARSGDGQGVIDAIAPRQSLLYRSNAFRQKLIAANVTQILIVVATEPSFSDELITRCLVAAESQDLAVRILLNKCDLEAPLASAQAQLAPFAQLGTPILPLSARQSVDTLRPLLEGHTSVLVGQSGMGKSTLTNALVPHAQAATREISEALDSGKHTTTHATLYRLNAETALIDSPGLQEFGLHHLSAEGIEQGFPEFRPHLGQCRFRNCRHEREPDCAILAALERGEIDPRRYAAFLRLRAETA